MVPASFTTFFLAAATAGAAFVGLLFVAISICPRRTFGVASEPRPPLQHLAEAALLTLANGFLVSIVALIPGANVGWAALALGLGGVTAGVAISGSIARAHRHAPSRFARLPHLFRVVSLSVGGTALHLAEGLCGLSLVIRPSGSSALRWLALVVVGLFLLGTVRAWTLLGDARQGLSGWLNPLHDAKPRVEGARAGDPPSLRLAASIIPHRVSGAPGVGAPSLRLGCFAPEAPGGAVHHRGR